jgi:hypothetical protein
MYALCYEEARAIIADGDVVFIRGSWRSPIQALIMLFTASPYSHVCVAFWVDIGVEKRLMCIEAQTKARRRILALRCYDDLMMTVIAAPTPWNYVREDALSKVGKATYGLGEAIYIGVCELLFRLTKIRLPVKPPSREYCSTFVADLYQLPIKSGSPQALYEQLLAVSYCKEGDVALLSI